MEYKSSDNLGMKYKFNPNKVTLQEDKYTFGRNMFSKKWGIYGPSMCNNPIKILL